MIISAWRGSASYVMPVAVQVNTLLRTLTSCRCRFSGPRTFVFISNALERPSSNHFRLASVPVDVKSSPCTVTDTCFWTWWKLHGEPCPTSKPKLSITSVYFLLQFFAASLVPYRDKFRRATFSSSPGCQSSSGIFM